ncbi:MAG TPA: pseudouridine synthase, partial [Chloroflexia bacterium]|nr:pseudouridine synthase [Chloroflexia bacterium]
MTTPPDGERLQKVLARAGVASRRTAEELIQAGRVQVDGQVVTELGTRVDPARARITVDGRPVALATTPEAAEHVTYLLNKPFGVVSTAEDPQGRPTVVSLVPRTPRVYPVGRLDADTVGLLLLSNDGDLTYHLTHPRYDVEKEYEALVRGYVTQEALRKLRAGVKLPDEARTTVPARVEQVTRLGDNTLLRFVIHEGRNRQIRRMMQAVGGHVLGLRRVRLGPLTLGDLSPGQWRRLTPAEITALRQAVEDEPAAPAPPAPAPARGAPPGGRSALAAGARGERPPPVRAPGPARQPGSSPGAPPPPWRRSGPAGPPPPHEEEAPVRPPRPGRPAPPHSEAPVPARPPRPSRPAAPHPEAPVPARPPRPSRPAPAHEEAPAPARRGRPGRSSVPRPEGMPAPIRRGRPPRPPAERSGGAPGPSRPPVRTRPPAERSGGASGPSRPPSRTRPPAERSGGAPGPSR